MSKQSPTKREHYIPRIYLNGFASNTKRIYFYDLNTRRYSEQMVPVSSICFKNNLYEYRNKTNDIIYTNNIEKALGILESMFSQKRKALKSRIKLTNPHTTNLLSDEEIAFWITYLTIQTFRLPKVIDEITDALEELIPSNGEANFHRNTALYILLPFLKELDPNGIELRLYNELFSSINSLHCTIAYDDQNRLFASDTPMYMYAPTQRIQDCRKIVFPIDSSLCLIFSNNEFYPDNGIIPIDDSELEVIFKSIAYASDQFLYTSRKFTKQETNWISSARNNKEMDIALINKEFKNER